MTESIPQDALLKAVQSLFEHPEALRLLVENPALNTALVHYIDALAEQKRPKSDWQKIYQHISSDKRGVVGTMLNGAPGTIPVSLMYRVVYNDPEHVVRRRAYLYGTSDAWYAMNYFPESVPAQEFILDEVSVVQSMDEALEWGKQAYERALEAFRARTESLEDGVSFE